VIHRSRSRFGARFGVFAGHLGDGPVVDGVLVVGFLDRETKKGLPFFVPENKQTEVLFIINNNRSHC
jgi:hypothetical protein